jgi:hypothetical protein
MSPDARLSDAEFVHALERRATIAADHAEAILADQRLRHRLRALRTIKHRLLLVHLSIIAVSLTGCLRFETAEPAIGEAYIAPATLQLREEIAPRAQVTATLQHGARVEILARHRRFAKVRSAAGVTGWTDGRQLLSAQGMAIFRNQTVRASAIPPQGSATATDVLNVHITPYRSAPSFYQLSEGERVRLAGRSMMPRIQYVPPDEKSGQLVTAETLKDDWSLICLKDQRCGWVLTSLLMFELPDEIVQLAEGHRITAFFKLGETTDPEGKHRPIYLWTTSIGTPEQFQFDAFRVFAWNAVRARYESIYRERNLRGYHPVLIDGGKIRLVYGARPDGPVERHSFELRGRKLHLLKREPWQPPDQNPVFAAPLPDEPDTTSTAAGTWQRVSAWVRSLRK